MAPTLAPTLASTNVAPDGSWELVDEDGQVHVELVDVVGSALLLRPVVEHLCERDHFSRSDLKLRRARGSAGPADQQRLG